MTQDMYVDLENAGDFPLSGGFRVIEAGAGTGKTFNLVRLVLRLLVGHSRVLLDPTDARKGHRIQPIEPVAPKNILLVTFTDAAAMEMRQRLQELLEEVAALEGDARSYVDVDDDPDLRLKLEILQAVPNAAKAIRDALPLLGFMQISTIHTFCMRAYAEHAVPCGFPPLAGEPKEGGAIADEIAADWLRFQADDQKVNFPMRELTQAVQALMSDGTVTLPERLRGAKPPLHDFVRARSAQSEQVTFDDLIARMHRATCGHPDDDQAARVRTGEFLRNLRAAYALCLVDEAQDTDAQQMEIFRRIFDAGTVGKLLVLVGDPKQSIYGFRGANVDVYSKAAGEAVKPIYTLRTTRRSSGQLVQAFNALFSTAHFFTPGLVGKDGNPKISYPLAVPYEGKSEKPFLAVRGLPVQVARAKQPMEVARHACLLLRELEHFPRSGRQGGEAGSHKGLAQVAVLVRSNARANQIYRALAKLDMDVSVETDQCIFDTTTAFQVLLLLRAVLRPADMGLRKTLLLSRPSLFGPHARLDNDALGDLAGWLRDCRDTWEKHGFAQCWEKLTREAPPVTEASSGPVTEGKPTYRLYSVFESLAHSSLSRRSLVDLAHVGELLITRAHRNHWDMHQVLNYASVRIKGEDDESDADEEGTASEEEQIRPDSTSARILVRTIHKAKGLEYNAVLVDQAFGFSSRPKYAKSGDRMKDGDGTKTRIYSAGDADKASNSKQIEMQWLEEEARLFYVALTRAKQKVLLLGHPPEDEDTKAKGFSRLFEVLGLSPDFGSPGEKLRAHVGPVDEPPRPADDKTYAALRKEKSELNMVALDLPVVRWSLGSTSYSSLSKEDKPGRREKRPPPEVRDQELEGQPGSGGSADDAAVELFLGDVVQGVPLKPANMDAAEFGNVLHDLLEVMDFTKVDDPGYLERLVRRSLSDDGVLEGGEGNVTDEAKVAHLVAACRAWMSTPIAPPGPEAGAPFRLRDVPLRDRMSEARFAYSAVIGKENLERLKVAFAGLKGALSKESQPLAALGFPSNAYGLNVDGLLIGFIDLVFKSPVDGKYYLLDWKTNFLGASIADYSEGSMALKMSEARYHLQFSLYASVLHKHMEHSVQGWNYEEHFGGIIYLFLRGFGASPQAHLKAGAFCFKPSLAFIQQVQSALEPSTQTTRR